MKKMIVYFFLSFSVQSAELNTYIVALGIVFTLLLKFTKVLVLGYFDFGVYVLRGAVNLFSIL